MSVGSNLQEMENVVTKGAAQAEPMQKLSTGIAPGQTGGWEDLGGPTPENYRTDDDSAKLNTPGKTLAQVRNVVNAKAGAAEAAHTSATPVSAPGQGMKEETEEDEEDLIAEAEEKEEGEESGEAPHKEGKKEKGEKKEGKGHEKGEDDEEDEMKEEFSIEEDVNALLAGEELSEEFQEKARTIFEAAIKSKVAEIKEQLQSSYEATRRRN